MHPNAPVWLVVPLLVLAGCSGADQPRAGAPTTASSTRSTATPETPPPSGDPTAAVEPVPTGPSHLSVVSVVGGSGMGRLRVAGETVPGRWRLSDSRGDVWVAVKVGSNDYESQWWGKGSTPHPMPPSPGAVLRGGVVISPDSGWIVWTRPAGDVHDPNAPRVMEVVDTATGKVRWSRPASSDAPELGALAVTDDGVVVLAHCTEPTLDRGGWPQCDAARVDAWAPEPDVTVQVPAGVVADHGPPGTVTILRPLVETSGAHHGLLVRRTSSGPARYIRLGRPRSASTSATRSSGADVATARRAAAGSSCRSTAVSGEPSLDSGARGRCSTKDSPRSSPSVRIS